MANILDFSENTSPGPNDRVYLITDPTGSPVDANVKIQNLRSGIGLVVKRKTADESVTSSTTLQDDDELFFAAAANEIWLVEFVLFVDGATAGDIKVAVEAPTGSTIRAGVQGLISTAGTTSGSMETASTTYSGTAAVGYTVGTAGSGTGTTVSLRGQVVVGSTAGNILLRWAQGTSSGTASKVLTGSYLVGHRI